jgi:hypothetical protein
MFYAIPDTLLKVSLNTNKTGHHVVSYSAGHGDQFYWCLAPLSTVCQVLHGDQFYWCLTRLSTMSQVKNWSPSNT